MEVISEALFNIIMTLNRRGRASRGTKWNGGCFALHGIIILTVVKWNELFSVVFQFYIHI
jgi:hypothetical protein